MNIVGVTSILGFLLTAPLQASTEEQAVALTSEWVQRFEQSLDLNEALKNDSSYQEAVSVDSYARYYGIGVIDGVTYITAVYDTPVKPGRPGIHIGEPAPLVFDGGCGVITLRIEPETLRVAGARCNGLA
jgi:hypothetical protein